MIATFTTIFSCSEGKILELAQADSGTLYSVSDIKDQTGLSHRAVKRVVKKFLALGILRFERMVGKAAMYRFNTDLIGDMVRDVHIIALKLKETT